MTRKPRGRITAVVLLSTLLLGGAACAGGDSGDEASQGGDVSAVESQERGQGRADADDLSAKSLKDGAADAPAEQAAGQDVAEQEAAEQPKIISTARVVLEADDVVKARDAVGDVVADHGGKVDREETSGGEDARRSELVVRVPSEDFDDVLGEIGEVAEVTRTSREAEDVTTQVIDNRARIRAQERSIRRVELLLDRATSIRDIITIERQLADRQAKLDSLKQRRAYLADQTSMATITVRIERTDSEEPDEDDGGGFLGGLESGWKALVALGVGVLTILGAVLPFAVVVAVLGVPVWLLVRRRWRRLPTPAPAPAASGGDSDG